MSYRLSQRIHAKRYQDTNTPQHKALLDPKQPATVLDAGRPSQVLLTDLRSPPWLTLSHPIPRPVPSLPRLVSVSRPSLLCHSWRDSACPQQRMRSAAFRQRRRSGRCTEKIYSKCFTPHGVPFVLAYMHGLDVRFGAWSAWSARRLVSRSARWSVGSSLLPARRAIAPLTTWQVTVEYS